MEGKLRFETESLIVAAQDGVVHTVVYKTKIQGNPGSLTCRLCEGAEETVRHILSSCDGVLYQLVKTTATIISVNQSRSMRAPGGVIKVGVMGTHQKRILIDQNLPTDRTVVHTKLVVRLIREKMINIFEVAYAWEPLVQARVKKKMNTRT